MWDCWNWPEFPQSLRGPFGRDWTSHHQYDVGGSVSRHFSGPLDSIWTPESGHCAQRFGVQVLTGGMNMFRYPVASSDGSLIQFLGELDVAFV